MILFGLIGAKALYLLFVWLLSAAGSAYLAERKGYGERLGLFFGLILVVVGLAIMLLLPGRPGSLWKEEGALPRRGSGTARGEGPAFNLPADPASPTAPPPPPETTG